MVSSSSFLRKNGAGANEDWPELIDVGKVGEVMTVKTVFEPPKPKTIALKNISDKDLKSLKKKDPFSYYSIPGVRSASLLGKDIDTSDLGSCRIKGTMSCPARLQTEKVKAQSSTTVTRSKRISFECHPDLLLEDLVNSDEDLTGLEDFDLEEDTEDLLDFFMAKYSSNSC